MRRTYSVTLGKTVLYLILLLCLASIAGCHRSHQVDDNKRFPVVYVKDTSSITQRVAKIEEEIMWLGKYQNYTETIIEDSYAATNMILVTLTVVIALIAIYLTWYIGRAERKIRRMEKTITEKEKAMLEEAKKTNQLSISTESLVNKINNDIDSVFERIRRSDTQFLLQRLTRIPQDIVNVERLLFSRDLKSDDYEILKKAYFQLCEEGVEEEICDIENHSFGSLYMFVIFQHFFDKAIQDSSIKDAMLKALPTILDGCFKNDVVRSIKDIALALSDKTGGINRPEILYIYRRSLAISKFGKDESLSDYLEEELSDNELWTTVETRINEEDNG